MDNKKINEINDKAMEENNNLLNRNERNNDFIIDHAINNDQTLEDHENKLHKEEKPAEDAE